MKKKLLNFWLDLRLGLLDTGLLIKQLVLLCKELGNNKFYHSESDPRARVSYFIQTLEITSTYFVFLF